MGVFNTIRLKQKCPYCKEVSEMEFQTKDGIDICMNIYKVGDIYDNGQFKKISAISSCETAICQLEAVKESIWKYGYYGGFSRNFDVYIYCDSQGRITNKIKIIKLNFHKGIMRGILGELKGKDDNLKIVKHMEFKKHKIIPAKMKPMTTSGWLDKFKEDSFDNGKKKYEAVLYLFNLEDGEETFCLWFGLRHQLDRIIDNLEKKLNLKKDYELASVFLSNEIEDLLDCYGNTE